jgi:hypothetical protein
MDLKTKIKCFFGNHKFKSFGERYFNINEEEKTGNCGRIIECVYCGTIRKDSRI